MLALEVLQSCPTQRSTLLTEMRVAKTRNYLLIMFDTSKFKPRIHHHMYFQIKSMY